MGEKLTKAQRAVLHMLDQRAMQWPDNCYGFNPCSFGGPSAAVKARALARRGLVAVMPLGDTHYRYAITPAGRLALREQESGR